jgi:hypothetical protein
VLDRINHALYVKCREKAERDASPTACIIDADSDEVARAFRDDVARYSDMMSPGVWCLAGG